MALTLAIENETQLPDGGPVTIRITGRRGIDIGRAQHLDWTLPDPDRVISSTHCEIRHRDGGFWLTDVSRNGTFVNGSDRRLHEPHRLRHGDRLEIGRYIVAVSLDSEDAAPAAVEAAPALPYPDEIWGDIGDAPPPISHAELRPPPPAPLHSNFLDWAVDLPQVESPPSQAMPSAAGPAPAAAYPGLPARSSRPLPAADLGESWAQAPAESAAAWSDPGAEWGRRETPRADPARPAEPPPENDRLPVAAAAPDLRQPAPPDIASDRAFLRRLAKGAGAPESIFGDRDAGDVAEEVGALLRIAVEDVKQMLSARAESRAVVRSSRQTMIQAFDNNPLKFSPTAEDALRILFGPPSKGYLGPLPALSQSFDDLKAHQLLTFAAMQQAVHRLAEDLDPATIEKALSAERKGGVLTSRRARLWDRYVAWWTARTSEDNGLLDTFMLYFSESYQRLSRNKD